MNKNLTNRLALRSPRGLGLVENDKLPDIKNLKFEGKLLSIDLKTQVGSRITPMSVINFFDLPSPVNDKKAEIVKNYFDRKKEKKEETDRKEILNENARNEIQNNLEFIKGKIDKKEDGKGDRKGDRKESGFKDETLGNKKSESLSVLPESYNRNFELAKLGRVSQVEEELRLSVRALTGEITVLKESNLQLQQEIVIQNKSTEQLTKNLTEEKMKLLSDIDYLNSKIFSQSEKLDHDSVIINKLKQEKIDLKSETKNLKSAHFDTNSKLESKISELSSKLEEKEKEISDIQEMLKASEQSRKKSVETAKDLELELASSKKQKDLYNKNMLEMQSKVDLVLIELGQEKNKIIEYDELKQEISAINYKLSLIKEENQELVFARKVVEESLETVQKNFDNARLAWREKENLYNNNIQDLLEQVQSEKARVQVQATETAKLRRALTLRDVDKFGNNTKEELSRYQQKMIQVDKEHNETLIEIDKLKRNIDYYRQILKNKEEIIKKIDPNSSKSETGKKEFVKDWLKMIQCGVCFEIGLNFAYVPCGHLTCAKCKHDLMVCKVCEKSCEEVVSYCEEDAVKKVMALAKDYF